MNRLMKYFAAALLMFLVLSCQKEYQDGCVCFRLEEGDVIARTKGKVSDYAQIPSADEFELVIKNISSSSVVYSGRFIDWKEDTKLRPGDYSAEVRCGAEDKEGPASPFFYGDTDFRIQKGQKTEAGIEVSLGNSIVNISCTESFRNYYPESHFHIETPVTPEGFDYDGKPVFVAYQFSISGLVKDVSGVASELKKQSWKCSPATSYTIVYDLSNVGGATINILFDDTLIPVDAGNVDLNEEN